MKNTTIVQNLLLLMMTFIGLQYGTTFANSTRFWENRINNAVTIRNAAFMSLVPESAGIVITAWPQSLRAGVLRSIDADGDVSGNPWHLLIKGMLLHASDPGSAVHHLGYALGKASDEPGTVWLLFVEFNRYHLDSLALQALSLLEKEMFAAGGQSSHLISNQLIHLGQARKLVGENQVAQRYFHWAHRFSCSDIESIIHRARLATLAHPVIMAKTFAELLPVLTFSWKAQLEFFGFWYEFCRRAVILFALFITVIIALRYLPATLHRATHFYPDRIPPLIRTLLASGVVISLCAFGIIPFIWFLAFLFWRMMSRSDRLLFGIVLAIITLAPLDALIIEKFDRSRNPEGPLMHLSQALDEGRDALDTPLKELSREAGHQDVFFGDLAHILDDIKKGDRSGLLQRIDRIASPVPNDPVVANVKGIILMLNGSIDSASACFKAILQSSPGDVAATFNLFRCSLALGDATNGMELLKNAARLRPAAVNDFITGNDRYFSGNWPPLRSVMFPDYTPGQFWKWVFMPSRESPRSWNDHWGMSFLGIPPHISMVLFILMFLGLIVSPYLGDGRAKPRQLFECKYCGRITCRHCSSGVVCISCTEKTIHLKGSRSFGETIQNIADFTTHSGGLRTALMNLLVPGSGSRSKMKSGQTVASLVGIFAASIVYAWWWSVMRGAPLSWMTQGELVSILSIPLLFHLSCIIFYLPAAARHHITLLRPEVSKERNSNGP